MKNIIKTTALTALALASGAALADQAETKGGIKVKTDDGRFEANVGGRIHFDFNSFSRDESSFEGFATPAGSEMTRNNSTAYLRRVYLTLKGKAYGWNYKIEPDLANDNQSGATAISFQDVTLSTDLFGGELIFGQFKPFRSMEDLTSSNDLLMIERPSTSSNGVFAGREFQQGVGYKYPVMDGLLAEASVFSLRSSTSVANEGMGYNARIAYAPVLRDGVAVVHVGVNYSVENPLDNSTASPAGATNFTESFQYAGRRGPSINLGSNSGSEPINTLGLEVAMSVGPVFLQSEFVQSKLDQQAPASPGSQTVEAYYAQAAYELTGESKPYKKGDAVFGSVKPYGAHGAFELTARIDGAKNKDSQPGACAVKTTVSTVTLTNSSRCEGHAVSAGLNWYANPNVRFMFNYIKGTGDAGAAGTDKPTAYVARAQISF